MLPDGSERADAARAILKLMATVEDKLLLFGGARKRLVLSDEARELTELATDATSRFGRQTLWLLEKYRSSLIELAEAAAIHQPELMDSEWSDTTILTPIRGQEIEAALAQYLLLLKKAQRLHRYSLPLQWALRHVAGA